MHNQGMHVQEVDVWSVVVAVVNVLLNLLALVVAIVTVTVLEEEVVIVVVEVAIVADNYYTMRSYE